MNEQAIEELRDYAESLVPTSEPIDVDKLRAAMRERSMRAWWYGVFTTARNRRNGR